MVCLTLKSRQKDVLSYTNDQNKPINLFLVQKYFKYIIVVVMEAFVLPVEHQQ